jgi:hypothetical protein
MGELASGVLAFPPQETKFKSKQTLNTETLEFHFHDTSLFTMDAL